MYDEGKEIITGSIKLLYNSTVFQAEIREAVKEFQKQIRPEQKYVKIFTDSQAALKALNRKYITQHTVHDAHIALNSLSRNSKKVTIQWIKAHVGYQGNEIADEYAKLGAADELNMEQVRTTKNDVNIKIGNYFYRLWEERWSAQSDMPTNKTFLSKAKPQIS